MYADKYRDLIDALLAKTDRSELNWKQGVEDNAFKVDFSRHSLVIRYIYSSPFEEVETACEIKLFNESGLEVDSFVDSDIDDHNQVNSREKFKWFTKMKDLFERARRNALGADKVLNDILMELDDIPF